MIYPGINTNKYTSLSQKSSRPQTPQTDQNADIANVLQGEHVGEQVREGVVGVPHRRHEEGHHSAGEHVEDNDAEHGNSNGDNGECFSFEPTSSV